MMSWLILVHGRITPRFSVCNMFTSLTKSNVSAGCIYYMARSMPIQWYRFKWVSYCSARNVSRFFLIVSQYSWATDKANYSPFTQQIHKNEHESTWYIACCLLFTWIVTSLSQSGINQWISIHITAMQCSMATMMITTYRPFPLLISSYPDCSRWSFCGVSATNSDGK